MLTRSAGEPVGGAQGQLPERGEPQPRFVRWGAERRQQVDGRGGEAGVQPGEQSEALDQSEADALVVLVPQLPYQQRQYTARCLGEPYDRRRYGAAHLGVRVRHEVEEDRRTRPDRGPRHGVVVVRPILRVRAARVLVATGTAGPLAVGLRGRVVDVPAADAGEQLHDAATVRKPGVPDEAEEEGDARERRVVHIALVVHRPVHPVERRLPLMGVPRGQAPQQLRHVRGASVGMLHRGPVDLVDPPEHGVLPRRTANDRECAPRH